MKILIISNHSYMLYKFRRELIDRLSKENEVVLCMPFVGHENDFRQMGIRCVELDINRRGISPAADLRLIQFFYRQMVSEKPDLVITYSIKPNIYAGLVCSALKIPYCANIQGLGTAFEYSALAGLVKCLYRISLRKAKVVFFENEGDAEAFLTYRILPRKKMKVLPGAGVNLESFPLVPYPENEKFSFLYLGRIMREKGVEELFAAARRLHRETDIPFQLDLVGFYEEDYESEVSDLVADGIAVFHGFQHEPQPFYATADCLVLPSYHEGMSNVLLEAAAIGRPVITSNIHGCREAVAPEMSGLLCDARNQDSLYDQMLRMLCFSRDKRREMGLLAREYVTEKFDKQNVVAMTVDAIESAMHTSLIKGK